MEGMTATVRRDPNHGFTAVVVLSLAAHAAAIGGVMWFQYRKPRRDFQMNSVPVQLVALGKKRDPKLLPRKVIEVPSVAPTEGVALDTKAENKEKPTKTAEKKDQKLSDAAKRLLEGTNPDAKLEEALSKIEDREGDPDGDIRGTTTDASAAAQGYVRKVMQALQSNYRLPETIPPSQRPFLKAEVLLFVESDGAISRFEFVERHPNEIFMGALESMLKSLKLPPPPATEAETLREAGLLVRFKPN
jgi:hypothetical protein